MKMQPTDQNIPMAPPAGVAARAGTASDGAHHGAHHGTETCAAILDGKVAGEQGIFQAALDPRNRQIHLDYDPAVLSKNRVERLGKRVAAYVERRFQTCERRLDGRSCDECVSTFKDSADSRMNRLIGVQRATVSLLDHAQPHNHAPTTSSSWRAGSWRAGSWRAGSWLAGQRLEVLLTVVTLAAMLLALLAVHTPLPPTVPAALYIIAYAAGGYSGFITGLKSLRRFTVDVDFLMILAALGAALIGAPFEGAMLLFLFSLSNVLQDYALDRTRNAIKTLMNLRPAEALVRRDQATLLLPIEQLVIGDHVLVRPGERVPIDGEIIEGRSALDQSSITGESMPVVKQMGDAVFAGTINGNGSLEVLTTKLAKDSTLARLIALVEEAQSEKAPTQRFLDKFEQVYAMAVILFTVLMIVVPVTALGHSPQNSFYRAMTLMVVASPCALIISTPASILSAIANGARKGVLFKGGAHLEEAAAIKFVAFDKTGTLTEGKPRVTDVTVIPLRLPGVADWSGTEGALLALAAAVEAKSEHPLARAIVSTARHRGIPIPLATGFQAITGKGVRATVHGTDICVGSPRFFETLYCAGLDAALSAVRHLQDEGKTAVLVARLRQPAAAEPVAQILGVIAIADVLRPEAAAAVRDLKSLGVQRIVMLTGDNERVATAIARQVGVDEFYADLLPEDKVRVLKELKQRGAVAMVGDGVNDAPALAASDLGIAMGAAGTDVALETADVVLMGDDLGNIPYAMALSRAARRVVLQNLVFAVAVIVVL
ncbi:MAG TPA: heavy metal translocating P-type ATPase, partial [Abditibacteriaceae bacterium]|nr:heavy metal translocating P-type ATPase [Abditibacteriaceae bacterium]